MGPLCKDGPLQPLRDVKYLHIQTWRKRSPCWGASSLSKVLCHHPIFLLSIFSLLFEWILFNVYYVHDDIWIDKRCIFPGKVEALSFLLCSMASFCYHYGKVESALGDEHPSSLKIFSFSLCFTLGGSLQLQYRLGQRLNQHILRNPTQTLLLHMNNFSDSNDIVILLSWNPSYNYMIYKLLEIRSGYVFYCVKC